MKHNNSKLLATTVIAPFLLLPINGLADSAETVGRSGHKVIDVYNPKAAGDENRQVHCDTLTPDNRLTCAFAEQIDGQDFCDDAELLSKTGGDVAKASNLATVMSIGHYAKQHDMCVAQYGTLLQQNFNQTGSIASQQDLQRLGDGWQQKTDCLLLTVYKQCVSP